MGGMVDRLADPNTGISPVVPTMLPVTLSESKVTTLSYIPSGTGDTVEVVLVTETNYMHLSFTLNLVL
jgi:hypothetical protein